MKRAAARTRPAARGFGLVEMMVSLALGLLVVGGASMLFIATRQANGSTDNLSRVIGTAVAARVDGTAAIAVRYGVALDNVTVVSHDTTNKIFTTSVSNHGLAAGDLLMVCNYRQAALFQATSANVSDGTFVHGTGTSDPGNCSAGLGLPTLCTAAGNTYKFSAGSMLARFTAAGWYIGYNGRTDGGGRSLYRVTRLGPEEVADGVRDMSLHYLLAEGSDYVDAASVTDWSQVMAVRMDLTFESPEVQAATRAGANSARMTRTVGFTINLRNMQP